MAGRAGAAGSLRAAVARLAKKRGETLLARFAAAAFFYGVFQQVLAMAMLWPSALVRLTPLQPMRYLHLEYFLS